MPDEQVQEVAAEAVAEPEVKAVEPEPEAKPAEEAKPEVNWQEKALAHQARAVFAENGIADAEVRADIMDLFKIRGGDKDFDEWFEATKADPKGLLKSLLVQAKVEASKPEAPKPAPKATVAAKADAPTVIPSKLTPAQIRALSPVEYRKHRAAILAANGIKE